MINVSRAYKSMAVVRRSQHWGVLCIERRGVQARSAMLSRGSGREAQAPLFRHLLGFEQNGRLPVSSSL